MQAAEVQEVGRKDRGELYLWAQVVQVVAEMALSDQAHQGQRQPLLEQQVLVEVVAAEIIIQMAPQVVLV